MAKKSPQTTRQSNQRALVIGVSNYPNPPDRLPAVAADVREMAKVLSSKNGTFPPNGVSVLADKQATREKVLAGLRSTFGGTSADTVFVYIAGHGFEVGGRYYYVAYDATSEATAVPLAEIKALFDRTKSRRAFLWLDFCHSGGILARGGSDDMQAIRRGIGVVSGHGKVIVAACTSAQKSYESSSIGHGFFTHALLRGLQGEAKSAQGEVTAHSLYEFIDHEVANTRQQPVFFGETTGRIVLMHYDKRATKKTSTAGKKSPAARPTKTTPKVKGTWIMLGDDFLVAERIRNHSDGSIEVAVTPHTGEHQAAIAALRPTQYGGARDLAFAANNDACQVRVEQVVDDTTDGKQVWTVKLRAVERQSRFADEVNVQGIGPDEIARRRVGRILLNDPPPLNSARSGGYDDGSFVDGFISGAMTGFEIKECVVRSMYRKHGQTSYWKEFARLKSIFLMKMTGTIEHVLELKIGAVRGGKVSVSFRGRRSQRYSNVAPEAIELAGRCPLE